MVNGFRKQRGLIKIKLCTLLIKLWLNYVPQKTCKKSFCLRIPFAIVTAMSDRVFSAVHQIAEKNFLNLLRHEKVG